MRISVREIMGEGSNHQLSAEPSTTIGQLKQLLYDESTWNEERAQDMCFTFEGEILDQDDQTLMSYGVEDRSRLEWANLTSASRNIGNIGIKFIDVSSASGLVRRPWSTTAPKWRRTRRGLCLEGECTNPSCEGYKQQVIMQLGYRKFNFVTDVNADTTVCPVCKKYVSPVNCGFNNCRWRFEGLKQGEAGGPPVRCASNDWEQADDAYHYFDSNSSEMISWRMLELDVVKKSPHIALSVPQNSDPPKEDRPQPSPGADSFAIPDKHWCPWKSQTCTNKLLVRGQGTVEILQRKSKPFEIRLSNRSNPSDPTAYAIILTVNAHEVTLSTSKGQSYTSPSPLHTLQAEDGNWHRYWISLFGADGNVKYGVGEIRPSFAVFNEQLPESDLPLIKEVQFLHVKVDNNDRMLTELNNISEEFRFFIGKLPITHDPALFVVPQDKYSVEHATCHTAIPPSQLEKACRDLYDSVINFKLDTEDFPNLTQVIEKSIRNPNGWCYKKLHEKANRFGKPNMKATYLRLTVGQREGNAPGHAYVVEVWPPGHFSPIHNHGNTYAIIRVLYGEISLRLYPELRLNIHQHKPVEQICREGGVTWMLPNLNQTHQLKHIDLQGKSCITIQCYAYGVDDRDHYEFFDYLANDEQSIGHFDPKSDMNFNEFKNLMKQEQRTLF